MHKSELQYPTPQHEQAADRIVSFFSNQDKVKAVLLTCSCARNKASIDSCLDMAILIDDKTSDTQRKKLEQQWTAFSKTDSAIVELMKTGKYSHVDLEFTDGKFAPGYHGWTSGPDEFELAIGNLFIYSVVLWNADATFDRLKSQWIPYYSEPLRRQRLDMIAKYFFNNLNHIPLYIERGLYFQSFRRFYNAFGEFLQALFISRKVYPIAYDKWVQEQIVDILKLPELYPQLPKLFELHRFESQELLQKAKELESLFIQYVINNSKIQT
ncbi:MAG: hypothetical protein ACE14V_02010 [bacterium]